MIEYISQEINIAGIRKKTHFRRILRTGTIYLDTSVNTISLLSHSLRVSVSSRSLANS